MPTWTKKDFRVEWFSGTGAGGQHRNKHQNCVRIIHIESGLSCTGQSYRERKRNFEDAFQRLGKKLLEHYHPKGTRERAPHTDTIRTYNIAENRVTDHRSGQKVSWDNFELDDMIAQYIVNNE